MRNFHGAAVNETCIHVRSCNFQAAQNEQAQLMEVQCTALSRCRTHHEIWQHLSCSHAQLWTMVGRESWQKRRLGRSFLLRTRTSSGTQLQSGMAFIWLPLAPGSERNHEVFFQLLDPEFELSSCTLSLKFCGDLYCTRR